MRNRAVTLMAYERDGARTRGTGLALARVVARCAYCPALLSHTPTWDPPLIFHTFGALSRLLQCW
eukprot:9470941-Pyramimonas_sp.AAC.1